MLLDTVWLKENWRKAMEQSEYFSLDKNTDEQAARHWSYLAKSYDFALGSDTKRAKDTVALLRQKGAITPDTVTMDIGCGTGVFSIELAGVCAHVYALDYSAGMLEKLSEKLDAQGITNVTLINADWKTFDVRSLEREISLSVSCLNTGMRDYDSLIKINEITKGYCCYITSSGVTKASRRNELQELVFGRTLTSAGGGDIIYPFNIIYALGYRPELSYIPCKWRREKSPEAALEEMVRDFGRYMTVGEDLEKKLDGYIRGRLNQDGLYEEAMDATLGIMIWRV